MQLSEAHLEIRTQARRFADEAIRPVAAELDQTERFPAELYNRVITTIGTHGFTIKNRKWEQTVEVKREVLEDDREGLYAPISQRMGEAAAGEKSRSGRARDRR